MQNQQSLFFDPEREAKAKRLRKYAEAMQKSGQQPQGTEIINGMAVKQSPLAGLARALQQGIGGYEEGQADNLDAETTKKRQDMLAGALSRVGTDPQSAANVLIQDPSTSDLAVKLGTDPGIQQTAMRNKWAAAMGLGQPQQTAQPASMGRATPPMSGPMPLEVMASQIPGALGPMAGPGGQTNVPANAPIAPPPTPAQFQQAPQAQQQAQGFPEIPPQIMQEMLIRDPENYARITAAQRLAKGGGGSTPAAIQIANEIQVALDKGDYDRANLLSQAQKMVDRGVNPYGSGGVSAMPGYGQTIGSIGEQRKSGEAQGTAYGKEQGTAQGELANLQANLPKLADTVDRLHSLGQKATYTMAGQGVDTANRQLGLDPREGAIARAQYISEVDNNILPLLRQTFGSQFTAREGDSLKSTLGDANKSPQEKDAVLRSFINQKVEQTRALGRQVGQEANVPDWQGFNSGSAANSQSDPLGIR